MAKEIIVNVGERETRIAVIEEGKLVELHIERAERVVGSLYKCRVANVLAGMDAAFVDIGLERNAFLYVGDVLPTGEEAGSGELESEERVQAASRAMEAAFRSQNEGTNSSSRLATLGRRNRAERRRSGVE